MDELYNQNYYENYDVDLGKVNYKTCNELKGALDYFAENIAKLQPKTVLDVGCALGHMVEGLRNRGIEGYGIDISEYAISNVVDEIKPYCAVVSVVEGTLPTEFPQKFDLVFTNEMLEHLHEKDAPKAIANLCKWADTIIFSSTPDDFEDPTHLNVRQREYWASLFAQNGFYDDLDSRPDFISNYSMCFRKGYTCLDLVESYERHIRLSELEYEKKLSDSHKKNVTSTLYWADESRILSEAQKIVHTWDLLGNILHFHTKIPAHMEILRFDPMEAPCVVEDLHVYSNQGALSVVPENAMEYGGKYIFLDHDPRFQILLDGKQVTDIDLRARITPLEFPEQEELLSLLLQRRTQLEQQLGQQRDTYEATISQLKASYETELSERKKTYEAQMGEQVAKQQKLQTELNHYMMHYHAAIGQREELKQQLVQAQQAYNVISNAFFWKITKPARVLLDCIKRPFRNNKTMQLIGKGLRCWKENGLRYTWRKVKNKMHHRQEYAEIAKKPLFTEAELEAQRQEKFPKDIKFSIVVPLYNTPPQFLHEMIRSVLDQTYGNWELCMTDGSDSKHGSVEKICRQYMYRDSRIKYRKLEKNLGISGNTNACLEMAEGDYIGLFDHDDLLHPAALREIMRAICEKNADFIYTDEATFQSPDSRKIITAHYKPDFAIDNLRANNYICHFSVFCKTILHQVKGFQSEYDGSQDHDFILRATECAKRIVHIPEILYYWRSHPNSVALNINSKTYAIEAGKRAVADHIARCGMSASVESSKAFPTIYRIKYDLVEMPLVSIIIPNKNHMQVLKKCIESIITVSMYKKYEIIIVDNQSTDLDVQNYYEQIKKIGNINVIKWDHAFNFAAINNFGVQYANGEYLILLNNDTEVITPDWIQEMLMYAQRHDVGAVGAKLYYDDKTIQHAGVILGLGRHRAAGHAFSRATEDNLGYMGRLWYAQDYSAVTAACMMVRKDVWEQVNGMDESFAVAFNDVDLCMRIRKAGYLIVWTPYAELYHYESKSRGLEETPEKKKRFEGEVKHFQERWKKELEAGDPYYNSNLTLDRADFSLR